MIATDGVAIGHVRISSVPHVGQALVTRLAVSSALARADLQPPTLPPAAVLIVRRLDVPGKRLSLQPVSRVDPAWERAARGAIDDLYRCASRPFEGPVAAGCPAVLFRDEAELLACLVLDVSLGRAGERWWWRAYLERWRTKTPDLVAALLAESPRLAPAALRLLAERDAAHNVLRCLTPSEAQQVLQAVCVAFDAPHLAQAAATAARQPQRPASTSAPAQSDEPERVAPPWQPFMPPHARLSGLTPPSACLLGVSLVLAQAPAAARSVAFAHAVVRWWQGYADPLPAGGQPNAHRAAEIMAVPPSEPVASPGSELSTFPKVGNSDPATTLPQIAQDRPPADRREPAEPGVAGRSQSLRSEPVAPAKALDGVVTELGGVLFLLNVMQRLDLPACFEPDWRLASQVGPWGVLELLGRALLQDAARLPTFPKVGNLADLAADPLWAALAQLAGRQPGAPAGSAVAGPDDVQIPATWARWLGADDLSGQRIDLAGIAPLGGPLLAGVSRDMRRWLAAVTPLLRRMLHRALGDAADLLADLLLRRGRLYVTSSHVDLVLPLESVSLPARRAGLDFDPGWLPDFGCVVQFHYHAQD